MAGSKGGSGGGGGGGKRGDGVRGGSKGGGSTAAEPRAAEVREEGVVLQPFSSRSPRVPPGRRASVEELNLLSEQLYKKVRKLTFEPCARCSCAWS